MRIQACLNFRWSVALQTVILDENHPNDDLWLKMIEEALVDEDRIQVFRDEIEDVCKKNIGRSCCFEVKTENDKTYKFLSVGLSKTKIKKSNRTYDELLYSWYKFLKTKDKEYEQELKKLDKPCVFTLVEERKLMKIMEQAGCCAGRDLIAAIDFAETKEEKIAAARKIISEHMDGKALINPPTTGESFAEYLLSLEPQFSSLFEGDIPVDALSNAKIQRRFIAAISRNFPKIEVERANDLLVEDYPELDDGAHVEVSIETILKDAPKATFGFWHSTVTEHLMDCNIREEFFKFVADHMVVEYQPAINKVAEICEEDKGQFYDATFAAWNGELFLINCIPHQEKKRMKRR